MKISAKRLVVALVAWISVLTVPSSASAASLTKIWAKDGAPPEAAKAELDGCIAQSLDVKVDNSASVYTGSFVFDVVASSVVSGILNSSELPPARALFISRCMRAGGYYAIELTLDEVTDYRAQRSPTEQSAWTIAFYRRADFSSRLSVAAQPAVPQLPQAAPEPLTFGAVRFDPAALSAANDVATPGKTVLRGRISHRRTGRLLAPVEFRSGLRWSVPAGAIFQQLVTVGEQGPDQTYWCSGAVVHQPFGNAADTHCVSSDHDGYNIYNARGEDWLSTGPKLQQPLLYGLVAAYRLDESGADLIGPLDFTLVVKHLGSNSVVLEARAEHEGDKTTFWTGELSFDTDGRATLPFWTHRLVLQRSGGGVAATFRADGDGKGWPDSLPPKYD